MLKDRLEIVETQMKSILQMVQQSHLLITEEARFI